MDNTENYAIRSAVINKAINYIFDHIDEEITVDDVAHYCSYSRYHLTRMFKEETDEALYQFIKRIRLERSAWCLKVEKEKSITEIGEKYGYSSSNFATAFKKTYTFGPTFRAENSNTKTHANEFWMIEPEIAFCDLEQNMDIMEDMLKYIVKTVLEKCSDEIEFLNKFVDKTLKEKLTKLVNSKFTRITHEEVITILKNSKVDFEFTPEYGEDIAKEHEKYITEYFNGPVFIYNWPKDIKAFYMKQNEDGKTVAAVDLEVPGAGELMGGSQREEDYDKLLNRMKELKQMIPNLNGSCADIDGVVVLPKYRGYGLQKTLVKYLEERAREKGISNIIAEVTFGNVYSLRNLKDLGYEEQTWYQKDKNIKRYILLKKLGETENG